MRSIEELWDSIKHLNFDETIDDGTAAEIYKRYESLSNGSNPTNTDFSLNDKVAALGGIHEVRRTIERDWTIEELEDFLCAWMTDTHEAKKSLMAETPPRSTSDGVLEDRVWQFSATLKSTYDSALIAIGAKCYADCKRSDTFLALHLDGKMYYRQTLSNMGKTLPPPLIWMLQSIGANTRRGADAAERNGRMIAKLQSTANETQTAANLAAENAKDTKRAAEQTAKAIDEIKDKMLALWRRWLYDKPGKPERARAIPPAEQKICGAMNDAAFGYWKAFQKGKLDGRLSAKKYDNYIVERRHKRSAKEFLQTHSKDVVWTAHDGRQYTLQELCPTVEDVQRMIDRNNKAIKRAKEKNGRLADKKKF